MPADLPNARQQPADHLPDNSLFCSVMPGRPPLFTTESQTETLAMGYQLLSVCQYCQPLAIVASSASCWINKKKEKDSTVYIDEALQLLGISYNTLKAWAKQGRVRRWKEEDGRWIYNDDDVYAMVGKKLAKDNWVVTYCRVAGTTESDRKLMADQQRVLHLWCAARGLSVDQQYEDWAPSTEYSLAERPGLHQLLQDIIQKRVSAVVVETPDRLARLGRELIEQICRYYGVQLVYVNKKIQRPEYLAEQEADLVRLLKAAKIDRLQDLGDQLPKPKKPKLPDPGKIVSDWEGAPLPKTSRELEQLGDLM